MQRGAMGRPRTTQTRRATKEFGPTRLRRMVDGQHHHVSPQYLYQYANHAAWLEDHRRLDNGALTMRAAGLALGHPVSRRWKGYWQRSDHGAAA